MGWVFFPLVRNKCKCRNEINFGIENGKGKCIYKLAVIEKKGS